MPINLNNPNQRTPCVLVLDASGSMALPTSSGSTRIDELNAGLSALREAIRADDSAYSRVSLSVIMVGGPDSEAALLMDWTDAEDFETFKMHAGGGTPLGAGMLLALKMVEEAKADLKSAGISYMRPWIIVISDGEPTDDRELWESSIIEARKAEQERKAEIFVIGVQGADLETLGKLSHRPAIALDGVKFKELFVWLSDSLSAATRSRPGENVELPSSDPWRNVGM
jgi:uncharacterized protein YegL